MEVVLQSDKKPCREGCGVKTGLSRSGEALSSKTSSVATDLFGSWGAQAEPWAGTSSPPEEVEDSDSILIF